MKLAPTPRPLLTAELVAVGSELTAGETQDTNGGELARSLSVAGVTVRRISDLPDDLALVTAAFSRALESVDLVVATGGLGPTPDDLTREAVAAAIGEEPAVDPALEAWLRDLFARRAVPLPEANLKQAWLLPSASAIPNPNGTAPGWWIDRPDGRVVVLLPGPPREMRPMWSDWVLPRLRTRGLGDGRLVRTLRTYGIGESVVAERLGEPMLRAANPIVATYARAEWLDVRISATDIITREGAVTPAADVLERTTEEVRGVLAGHVWAEDETSWGDLVTAAAERSGTRLATVEAGTGGALAGLLAGVTVLERAVVLGPGLAPDPATWPVEERAAEIAREAGTSTGLALVASTDGASRTLLRAAVAAPDRGRSRVLDLRLFQHGAHGRLRAAVAAAAFLVQVLGEDEPGSGGDARS
ncbi:MAG: molybdopterin-binding protein [Chloroflexi bacterium]|nr:molybdopterin-binding protein [Chloroflexota bacterium]